MSLDKIIQRKIGKYKPKGGLDISAKLFTSMSLLRHAKVREHSQRVGVLSGATAEALKKDHKSAFYAGLLHDFGKLFLPSELFDGREVSAEEYELIKKHPQMGFEILKDLHLFTAVCCGLHHGVYKTGYGITMKDIPKKWSAMTVKKALEIAAIVSICDFIDAFTHRKTKIRDGSNEHSCNFRLMLIEKYPNDVVIINTALKAYYELKKKYL